MSGAVQRAKQFIGARLVAWRRQSFARGSIRGQGLEIDALHAPLKLPKGVAVKYVDRLEVHELRHHYPELDASRLVRVDLVAAMMSTAIVRSSE